MGETEVWFLFQGFFRSEHREAQKLQIVEEEISHYKIVGSSRNQF